MKINPILNKICIGCNISYTTKNKKRKYCTQTCAAKYIGKNQIGKSISQFKKQNIKYIFCKICNKLFVVKDSPCRKNIKFCSKKCRNIQNGKNRKGKKLTTEQKIKYKNIALKYIKDHAHERKSHKSKSETLFLNRLEEIYNVKIKRQLYLGGRWYDGLIEGTNIIIESDCPKWHKKEIDELKNNIAKENGYNLWRFEINNIREVEEKIVKYKEKLDEIFVIGNKSH